MALTADSRHTVRNAVELAVRYWPNAHLGDYTPREDLRSAFKFLRVRLNRGAPLQLAAAELETDAYRHADM